MISTAPANSAAASAPATNVAPERAGSRNLNPAGIGFVALLREDLRTHHGDLFEQGFWAVSVHRFGNWRMARTKLLRAPLTLLYRFLVKWVEWTCGITLPYTVRLGRRVRIWHHGGVILPPESIGDDVHIRQKTTLGLAPKEALHQLPGIENPGDIGRGRPVLRARRVG